jgi:hypothetical protein
MKRSNYLIWFRRLVVLGAVVAGMTASTAGAIPMLDPQDTPANAVVPNTTPLGLRADGLRWQAIAKAYQDSGQAPAPDVFERYVAVHPSGAGAAGALGTERIVDDSFRDARTVVASPTSGNGLDWGDFGIGAGAMLGLALLVTGLGAGAVTMRHRAGKLGTS